MSALVPTNLMARMLPRFLFAKFAAICSFSQESLVRLRTFLSSDEHRCILLKQLTSSVGMRSMEIWNTPPECEIVTTRTLDAPRQLVYKAWTDPDHLKVWWGPNGLPTPSTCSTSVLAVDGASSCTVPTKATMSMRQHL